MKIKQLIQIIVILFLFTSCGKSQFKSKNVHTYTDTKTGLVVFTKEYPSNWQILTKPDYKLDASIPSFLYKIQGPKDLKIFNSAISQFFDFHNPQYNRMMKRQGMKIKSEKSIQSIIDREVVPLMKQQGYTFSNIRELPKLLSLAKEKFAENGANNIDLSIVGSEWVNNKGKKAIVIVNHAVLKPMPSAPYPVTIWMYDKHFMFSDAAEFESNLELVIASASTQKDNPKWNQYKTQLMAYRQKQQTAAHNQRMKSQQAQFNNHQRMMKQRYAAQDANHQRFMQNLRGDNSSSNKSHNNFINYIRDEETVSHPNGKQYQVQSGANDYWMNSNGEYIMSNDHFFNPNGNLNLNNQDWTKTAKNN